MEERDDDDWGPICSNQVPATLMDVEDRVLTRVDKEILWDIFVEIGRCWENLPNDSAGVKSSWLEFVQAKTEDSPATSASTPTPSRWSRS